MNNNKRSLVWDNYKGVLIFLVVFAHFLYTYLGNFSGTRVDTIFTSIYLFHMPAFIFCSGYFSVSDNSRSKKSIFKLLFYYIVFNTIMMLFIYGYKGTGFKYLFPYYSYWYLLSLVFWRLSIKRLNEIPSILPMSIIIAILIGFYPEFSNILSVRRTIAFFPFFLIGYKMAKGELFLKFNELIYKKSIIKHIISFILIIISLFVIYFVIKHFTFTTGILLMESYKEHIHVFYRIFMFIVAFVLMLLLLFMCPDKRIPILTKAGKNSLGIYVLHRFFSLDPFKLLSWCNATELIIYSFIISLVLVLILSGDRLNKWLNDKASIFANILTGKSKKGRVLEKALVLLFILVLLFKPITILAKACTEYISSEKEAATPIDESHYLSSPTKNNIDNAVKISYVGDLILLKSQITSAYNSKTKSYDFNDMFKYTKKYFANSDYSIGVFEGPTAGSKVPYSTSNYDDGNKLYLNFPDSFAKAVKASGIDLVTTANNHLLDAGYNGAYRTLDVLNKSGIKHVGSYKNRKTKDKLHMINVKGVKIAILSYVSAINYHKLDDVYAKHSYLTGFIPKSNSKYYNKMYKEIENDFKRAKKSKADLIMVMPHMGAQFTHETNDFQKKWNKIFSDLGADIILGDHAHAVQPIEYIGKTVIVNCPGNFANSYVKYDGDATSIVDLYIDKKTKKVIATDVIPMYTQEYKKNRFRAVPIYDIKNDLPLYLSFSKNSLNRVNTVNKLVTKVMIGRTVSFDNARERYYYIKGNYYIERTIADVLEKNTDKEIYKLLDNANSITFIGDSITEGTRNNKHPYYEPLMNSFKGKKVVNISGGGYTTKLILKNKKQQILSSKSDVYLIAIGTNDIRYRNKYRCAMTSTEYINKIKEIVDLVKKSNKDAQIVLIAPWLSLDSDVIAKLTPRRKNELMIEYSSSLDKFAKQNNYLYINPNEYIRKTVESKENSYLIDFIHPNKGEGVKLYSEAIIEQSK